MHKVQVVCGVICTALLPLEPVTGAKRLEGVLKGFPKGSQTTTVPDDARRCPMVPLSAAPGWTTAFT